jgi:hypothetical protein
MNFLSENIIPGDHGKVFGTDAKELKDLERIKKVVLAIEGVKKVVINSEIFPREFTVQTSKMVQVKDVEEMVSGIGFHAVPKGIFKL